MKHKRFLLLFFIFLGLVAYGGRLKSAFKALEVYNYFSAKQKLEKTVKRHPVASNYGLSIIYLRNDNPFHNIDSAYNNILRATALYSGIKNKLKLKYAKFGADSLSIFKQRDMVSEAMFNRAVSVNSEFGFQDFIQKNPWSILVDDATVLRDSLFFVEVLSGHKAKDFKAFMDKYPNSKYFKSASENYERQLYVEQTRRDNLKSYVSFIKNHPENAFRIDAEDRIYEIETASGSVVSYENFINTYPNNKNIPQAWRELYDAFLVENVSENAISDFLLRYPGTPYKKEVERELRLSNTYFYPVQSNNTWGFISEENLFKISSKYQYVEPFSEGLAAVTINDKVGYITKTGDLKIPCQFEDGSAFSQGYAMVEYKELYGLINRQGKFIIPAEYEDLGTVSDGFIRFLSEEKYGYFDRKGNIRIHPVFTDAFDFKNGLAKVKFENKWGIINDKANYVINPEYENLSKINDSVYALKNDDYWGALDLNLDTVIPFKYDYIGTYSNGLYMVTKNDSFNYVSSGGALALKENWQPVYPEYKILAKYAGKPILVVTDEGYNYLTLEGKLVFKYGKESLSAYDSIISFSKGNKWGFLSPDPPKEIIEPKYDAVKAFYNGYGVVSLGTSWGVIDVNDQPVIDFGYDEIEFLNDTLLIVRQSERYGLLTIEGDTLIPCITRGIEPYHNTIVSISTHEHFEYYNYATGKWIRKENE